MITILRGVPLLSEREEFAFPDPERAKGEGIVCAGGNLSPGLILSAYRQGIFPWYSEGEPILWWSPDPRFVVLPETFHVPQSAKRLLRRSTLRLTADRAFSAVLRACADSPRRGQDGTWIGAEMVAAYDELHSLGIAHSIEAWDGENLAGGLYGLAIGKAFFGESMFSVESGSSRFAFLRFAEALFAKGYHFIDSQVYTEYVAGMGGVEIPRRVYLSKLKTALACQEAETGAAAAGGSSAFFRSAVELFTDLT